MTWSYYKEPCSYLLISHLMASLNKIHSKRPNPDTVPLEEFRVQCHAQGFKCIQAVKVSRPLSCCCLVFHQGRQSQLYYSQTHKPFWGESKNLCFPHLFHIILSSQTPVRQRKTFPWKYRSSETRERKKKCCLTHRHAFSPFCISHILYLNQSKHWLEMNTIKWSSRQWRSTPLVSRN